jgi:hypothetical protein
VEPHGVFDPEGDAADIEGTAEATVLNKDWMLWCEFFPSPKCNVLSEGTE